MLNNILKLQTLCILKLNNTNIDILFNSPYKNIIQFIIMEFWNDIGNCSVPVKADICSRLLKY